MSLLHTHHSLPLASSGNSLDVSQLLEVDLKGEAIDGLIQRFAHSVSEPKLVHELQQGTRLHVWGKSDYSHQTRMHYSK